MIGTNQLKMDMGTPAIAPTNGGNTFRMSDSHRYSASVGQGSTSYVQGLIDKQKKGFPLDPHEQEVLSQYEDGFIDINGRRTGKSVPADGIGL